MTTDTTAARDQRARDSAASELRALAALIRRRPLDDVQIDLAAALRLAAAIDVLTADEAASQPVGRGDQATKFKRGDRVEKIGGSSWCGMVVGEYSTSLTPEGYAVESEREPGSVQIYPAKALRLATPAIRQDEPEGAGVPIPDGWALVPVEPTAEMVFVGQQNPDVDGRPLWKCATDVQVKQRYAAMLAASPRPAATDQAGEVERG